MSINHHHQAAAAYQRRCFISLILLFFLASILMIRLGYLQIKHHAQYATLSKNNILSVIPIPPNRGLIYDRNGVLLATNKPSFTLSIIPERIHNLKATLNALNHIAPISASELKSFHKHRHQYHPYEPIPLKYKLTESETARLQVNQYALPGVVIQTRMSRFYPLAARMSAVLGYVGRITTHELSTVNPRNYTLSDEIGKMGVEKYYETRLHGTAGSQEVEIDATGHITRILKKTPPIPGETLYLTIDSRLQVKAEDTLGSDNGAVVMINPQNGEVLTLVSHPSFNPNLFVNGISVGWF